MKHAYLIIAHNEPLLLDILLKKLSHPNNTLFVHIDKKVQGELLANLLSVVNKWGGVTVERQDVVWGDFSIVSTELELYKTALAHPVKFQYFHLLSGVDLPIKPISYINAFFETHAGKEFFRIQEDESNKKQIKEKTNYYYLFSSFARSKSYLWTIIRILHLPRLSMILQQLLGVDRSKEDHCVFYKGDQWCSLTRKATEYIVSKEAWIRKRFRFTNCADEIYKQTLLMNSSFAANVYKPTAQQSAAIRLIDWDRGIPYVWTDDDIDSLIQDKNLFARKFSSTHPKVIAYIDLHT